MLSPHLQMNDGNSIPQLGFGVYKTPAEYAEKVVSMALDAGYRHIDTAMFYGNEAGVGRAVREHGAAREDIFVTTKVWNDDHGFDNTLRAFDASLERLGLDYVDLYLIHWPMPMNGLTVDTWEALIRIREDGLARSIGVSNFPSARIDELIAATGVTPAINQVELNPYFAQVELRAENAARGVLTEAWAPLARGGEIFDDPTIVKIAESHGATSAQIVLAWHLAVGNVAIPKSVTPSRIEENFGALSIALAPDEVAQVSALNRGEKARGGFDPETMTRIEAK